MASCIIGSNKIYKRQIIKVSKKNRHPRDPRPLTTKNPRHVIHYPAISIFSRTFEGVRPQKYCSRLCVCHLSSVYQHGPALNGMEGPGPRSHGERLHGQAVRSGLAII